MKKIIAPILFAASVCVSAPWQDTTSQFSEPQVIPRPQQCSPAGGPFKLTMQTRVIVGRGCSASDRFAVQQLNGWLVDQRKNPLRVVEEKSVRKLPKNIIYFGSPRDPFGKQWLKARKTTFSTEQREEGYIFESNRDEIVILGESDRGRFYGMMTLLQLLTQQKKSVLVPGLIIRDWPQQKIRGISDDLSRGQVSTMDNFKKIIRFLAAHKLNVYSPYIEDIFVFRSHPEIGKGRGDLTAAEVKDLDAYAKQYHVELIPIFETLGHWENILSLPQYRRYAEFPGAHTLNVADDSVYKLLDDMISELSEAFSSPYFNMAADESWDVGLGANKARVAVSDLATVHAEHYKRVVGILRKYKKEPMMYGDVILNNPAILTLLPKDILVVDWHYNAAEHYQSPSVFKNAGIPFVVSPAVWSFTGPFPNYINTMMNVQNLAADGFRNGSLGLITSNWNDYGGEALRELNYYGYAWTAECAWHPFDADVVRFDSVFFRQYFGEEHAARAGQSVYAWLSSPLNQIGWNDLWRHPMLPVRQSIIPVTWRQQSLTTTMPLVLEMLSELKASIKRNPDQVELLAFVARLSRWYVQKLEVAEELKQATSDSTQASVKQPWTKLVLMKAHSVLNELCRLKEEFRSLWLQSNRSQNLNLLLMRYDRQAAYWEEAIRGVEQTGVVPDPLIESQWIYHPQTGSGRLDSPAVQIPTAYFRRILSLIQPVSGARLQLIGDTYGRLWVNGVEVGEVFARRSLSLLVEHKRVKMWDVTSLLKPGDNVLAVEVENYNARGSAGFNLYGELRSSSSSTTILSDSTWKVSARAPEGWQIMKFDDTTWYHAVPREYPFQVVRPNLDTGRLSWIER